MIPAIDGPRLLARLARLGDTGRDAAGRLTRLAGSPEDGAGRDLLCAWLGEAGLDVAVDRMGNIFGLYSPPGASGRPVMTGSHIDTVIDAGTLDGAYGVLAGLAAIEALQAAGTRLARPLAVAAFTNEEGVRFSPDMMGSLVAAGGLSVDSALAAVGTDGVTLGAALAAIGYAGSREPGFLLPEAYVELHIEQGPVLEAEGLTIGAVDSLQGISWQRVTITGTANHAGTTPMRLRRDAGAAAARVIAGLAETAFAIADQVATVGTLALEPGAINVIPGRAVFTVDLRNPDEGRLRQAEAALERLLGAVRAEGLGVAVERLARFEPVAFDPRIADRIEAAAAARQLRCRRMASGAGHDAQMMARVAPAAMIFVPSRGGISHNPAEHTDPADLVAGASVLLDVLAELAT